MGVIVVVLPNLENAKKVKKILMEHGFQTVFACSSAAAALQMVNEYPYGLVISGYRMPDMYYLDLVDCLPRNFESVLVGSEETVARAGAGMLSLTMPVKAYDLVNTANMVLGQLERRVQKKSKAPKKRSEKEENYIRNAKFLLMERNYLTEDEAHKYLQKCSMDNGINMVETAQMILTLLFDET